MPRPSLLIAATLVAMNLAACERPTVINVPAPAPTPAPAPAPVPGPPGPQGATGNQGNDGLTGNTGSTGSKGAPGEGTTVIVVPPAASAPGP